MLNVRKQNEDEALDRDKSCKNHASVVVHRSIFTEM